MFTKTNPTPEKSTDTLTNRELQNILDGFDFTLDNSEALKFIQEKTGLNSTLLQLRYDAKRYEVLKILET